LDPAEITSALGIVPTRTWLAGDPRTTPNGTPLEGRYHESYWTSGDLTNGEWPGRSLADSMDGLLDRLVPHQDFFRSVRDANGTVEFFVGWFFEGNSGDIFKCGVLARMADLGIDLSLDIYPPDQPQAGI
jgi:hypothetical protein